MQNLKVKSHWRLGEIMIQKAWLTWNDLANALTVQRLDGRRIGEILVSLGFVTQVQTLRALSYQYNVPFLEMKKVGIDKKAVNRVPRECAESKGIMPYRIEDDCLYVAASDMDGMDECDDLREIAGVGSVSAGLAVKEDIRAAIERCYRSALKAA